MDQTNTKSLRETEPEWGIMKTNEPTQANFFAPQFPKKGLLVLLTVFAIGITVFSLRDIRIGLDLARLRAAEPTGPDATLLYGQDLGVPPGFDFGNEQAVRIVLENIKDGYSKPWDLNQLVWTEDTLDPIPPERGTIVFEQRVTPFGSPIGVPWEVEGGFVTMIINDRWQNDEPDDILSDGFVYGVVPQDPKIAPDKIRGNMILPLYAKLGNNNAADLVYHLTESTSVPVSSLNELEKNITVSRNELLSAGITLDIPQKHQPRLGERIGTFIAQVLPPSGPSSPTPTSTPDLCKGAPCPTPSGGSSSGNWDRYEVGPQYKLAYRYFIESEIDPFIPGGVGDQRIKTEEIKKELIDLVSDSAQAGQSMPPPPPGAEGNGLKGYYFNNTTLEPTCILGTDGNPISCTAQHIQIDPYMWLDWGLSSPTSNDCTPNDPNCPQSPIPADNFSVRWYGQVWIPKGGQYIFGTISRHGARLWIDGKLQEPDNWYIPDEGEMMWSDFWNFSSAGLHDIRLEYWAGEGEASMRLHWAGPSIPTEIIPTQYLFPRNFKYPNPNVAIGDYVYLDAVTGLIVDRVSTIIKDHF